MDLPETHELETTSPQTQWKVAASVNTGSGGGIALVNDDVSTAAAAEQRHVIAVALATVAATEEWQIQWESL